MTNLQLVSLRGLQENLIQGLHQNNYKASTVQLYNEHINQLHSYMLQQHISKYSPEVANSFYEELIKVKPYTESTKRFYRTVIRRLNDCYTGNGYVYSAPRKNLSLSIGFQTIVNNYIAYCEEIGNSPFTTKDKERAAHFFCENLEALGCYSFDKMTAPVVTKATIMITNRGLYPAIKDLLRYLQATYCVLNDFSTLVPKSNQGFRVPTTYTPEEIVKVENIVNKEASPGKRDYAIILLASRLGIRAGDIADLKFENLDFINNRITFFQNKTGNYTDLLLLPNIKNALQDYINNERPDSSLELVFLSSFAPYGRISYSVVSFAVKKNMERAGVDTLTKKHGPHSLRSSLATSMINDGIDYASVRKVLGHEGANTIRHYAELDIERLRLCALPAYEETGDFSNFLKGGVI